MDDLPVVKLNDEEKLVESFPAKDSPQRMPAAATGRRKREKVQLEPGCSPLDWAMLTSSGKNLRGVDQFQKYTLEDLKSHNTEDDAWTAIENHVYNITPYLKFHPGGVKELMRVAGRDGTRLFMLTHAWVNHKFLLEACLVGILQPGPSTALRPVAPRPRSPK